MFSCCPGPLNVLRLDSSESQKSSAEAAPSGVEFRPATFFAGTSSGSSVAQKSSAEATPSGVSNTTTTVAAKSSEKGGKTKAKA
ncbi:hypothetical protein FALBO_15273, partial [Fusarium albosuccineum]